MDRTFFATMPLVRLVLTGLVFATALVGAPGEPINGSDVSDNSQQATALNATPLAGPHRPANVPEDMSSRHSATSIRPAYKACRKERDCWRMERSNTRTEASTPA